MGSTFPGVTAFAFMACMLLIGTVLRARIGMFRSALLPASLIGGGVGFALISMDWSLGYQSTDFTAFTFHFFTLSFMSLVLTGREKSASRASIVLASTAAPRPFSWRLRDRLEPRNSGSARAFPGSRPRRRWCCSAGSAMIQVHSGRT